MKPDYKNWMPKGMIWSFLGGAIGCGIIAIVLNRLLNGTPKTVLTVVFAVLAVIGGLNLLCAFMNSVGVGTWVGVLNTICATVLMYGLGRIHGKKESLQQARQLYE